MNYLLTRYWKTRIAITVWRRGIKGLNVSFKQSPTWKGYRAVYMLIIQDLSTVVEDKELT